MRDPGARGGNRGALEHDDQDLLVRSDTLMEQIARLYEALSDEKERLKRIHADLERTYFRYRQLFDLAPVAFLTLDETGVIRDINRAGLLLFALDRKEQVRFTDLVEREDAEIYGQHVANARSAGVALGCQLRLRTRDGSVFYARIDGKVMMEPRTARIVHLLAVTDISESKRAERLLHEAKELAEATVSSFADAVITTDTEGRITGLNAVAEALTEWSSDEALGEPVTTVFRVLEDEDRGAVTRPLAVEALAQRTDLADDREGNSREGNKGYVSLVSRTGERRVIRGSAAPIRSRSEDVVGMVISFADATESQRIMQEVVFHANHDPLTGLINRREFERQLERAIRRPHRLGGKHVLCFLDVDHLKLVNDVAGHQAGDELLKKIAGTIKGMVRTGDIVARLGGDEFAILLKNCCENKAVTISEMIVLELRRKPFVWQGHEFEVSASIGLATITAENESSQQVLHQADSACYTAKNRGRNRVHIKGMSDEAQPGGRGTVRLDHIRAALEMGHFKFMCQPIFPLSAQTRKVVANEALLRLPDRFGGLHLPAAFLPLVERYGLMGALDRWVLGAIFRADRNLILGPDTSNVSINISAQSLNDPAFLGFVEGELAATGFPQDRLWFEVTEKAAIYNVEDATTFMREMRGHGCRIALDDFGTGLSSFTYLKHFPVDLVKIDRSFVHNLKVDAFSRSVVAAIAKVAKDNGMETVGEGVETPSALSVLMDLEIHYAQGYALGIPVPLSQVASAGIAPHQQIVQMGHVPVIPRASVKEAG